jgi:hypothetical protein
MGTADPPVVQRDGQRRRVIDRWSVPVRLGSRTIEARGEIAWVPPPSPVPYVVVAIAVAVAVFLAARTRVWPGVVAGALAGLVVAEILHVAGLWDASTASAATKLVQSTYSLGGILLGVLALTWMVRRGASAAMPLVLVAAIVLSIAGGLSDLGSLGHSQLPSTLEPEVARGLIVITLGLGAGLTAAAAARLRVSRPRRAGIAAPARRDATVTS